MRVAIAEDAVLLREGLIRLLMRTTSRSWRRSTMVPISSLSCNASGRTCRLSMCGCRRRSGTKDCGPRSRLDDGCRTRRSWFSPSMWRSGTRPSCWRAAPAGSATCSRIASPMSASSSWPCGRVAQGGTVLDPEVVAQLVTRRRRDERLSSLTQREQEVLALMAEGRTNNAIADASVRERGTVEKHIRGVFTKLGPGRHGVESPPGAGRAHLPPPRRRRGLTRTPDDQRQMRPDFVGEGAGRTVAQRTCPVCPFATSPHLLGEGQQSGDAACPTAQWIARALPASRRPGWTSPLHDHDPQPGGHAAWTRIDNVAVWRRTTLRCAPHP